MYPDGEMLGEQYDGISVSECAKICIEQTEC